MSASGIAPDCTRRRLLRVGPAASLLAMTACSDFFPSSGPRLAGVTLPATQVAGDPGTREAPAVRYVLVNLDPAVVPALEADAATMFSPALIGQPEAEIRFGVGDILTITIFETQAGGLFIPIDAGSRAGNFVTLPQQQIGRDGMVTIPFGGQIRALGRTANEVEAAIAARLRQRALEPQVMVSLVDRRSSTVSVVGDVDQSLRFPLDPGGDRILSAIARAGGTRFAPHETLVTLQRAGKAESVLLSDIVADPRLNVQMQGGDTIVVARQQRFFLAVGAVGQSASITQLNRRFPFDDKSLSLADALARAGGVQDDRANPSAVFLFRFEKRNTLERVGIRTAEFVEDLVPTVYRADLLNPATLFLTQRVPMRHNDLIFVSNAPSTDLLKFLQIILPITQSAASANVAVR